MNITPTLNPRTPHHIYERIENFAPGGLPYAMTPDALLTTTLIAPLDALRQVAKDKILWSRLPEDVKLPYESKAMSKQKLRVELLEILCTYN